VVAAELEGEGLPEFYRSADLQAIRAQRLTMLCNRLRLGGAVIAAVGGAFSLTVGRVNLWGLVALTGFATALIVEIVMLVESPDRAWYTGRALAESVLTLTWRYAVGADPFIATLSHSEAKALMAKRLKEVWGAADATGAADVIVGPDAAVVTGTMDELRSQSFETRKATYIQNRTGKQRQWYASRARKSRSRAWAWRVFLIITETLAVVLAAGRGFGVWSVDWSGILASVVAAGAAWLSVKQYESLAAAYAVAARELAISQQRLEDSSEAEWPDAVADAEEAISREHTMWLASRTV
jgi:hypothetical protein